MMNKITNIIKYYIKIKYYKYLIVFFLILLVRETIYGRMWYFTSDFSRGDTAYTKLALDRHTDTTYFQEPCG